jgi:hypothetical protein
VINAARPRVRDAIDEIAPDFRRIDVGKTFPEAKLIPPTTSGYLLLAAEIDHRPMFLPSSRHKRELVRRVKGLLSTLRRDERVLEAVAFDGLLAPARPGEVLKDRPAVPIARFDFAVLVETTNPETAEELEQTQPWSTLSRTVEEQSRRSYRCVPTTSAGWAPSTIPATASFSSTTSSPIAPT